MNISLKIDCLYFIMIISVLCVWVVVFSKWVVSVFNKVDIFRLGMCGNSTMDFLFFFLLKIVFVVNSTFVLWTRKIGIQILMELLAGRAKNDKEKMRTKVDVNYYRFENVSFYTYTKPNPVIKYDKQYLMMIS